jgi:hypothetical protein
MHNSHRFTYGFLIPLATILIYSLSSGSFVHASSNSSVQVLFSGNVQGETEPCG